MAFKSITPCNQGELRKLADEMIGDENLHLSHLKDKLKHYFFSTDFSGKRSWDGGRVSLARGLFALALTGRLRDEDGYTIDGSEIDLGVESLVFEINEKMWKAVGRKEADEAALLKRQVLYRLFCEVDISDDGKLTIGGKPDIVLFSQEISVFGDQHEEMKKVKRLLESGGQEELPLDTKDDVAERGPIITEPRPDLPRIAAPLLGLPAYAGPVEDILEAEVVSVVEETATAEPEMASIKRPSRRMPKPPIQRTVSPTLEGDFPGVGRAQDTVEDTLKGLGY